jgi:hypothetical protein
MTMPPARSRHERDPEAKRPKGMRERALSLRDRVPKGPGPVEGEEPMAAPQMRNVPRGFWAKVIVGVTAGLLYVVTPFRPDWIEAIGGFDPDQHDGSVEWIIVMVLLVVTLAMLGAIPWIARPEDPSSRDGRVG